MNCIIIEDETIAAQRLHDIILKCDPEIKIIARLQSVKQAVDWFNANASPNLIFMDIQLADGLSFEIFEQAQIEVPVIFTTAFDEYALQAFKVNSIDYLLKPVEAEEVCRAIDKYLKSPYSNHKSIHSSVVFDKVLQHLTRRYKTKFVIKVANRIKIIPTNEIACFYSMEKSTFLQNLQGRDYAINHSLDELENLLDPTQFFRISRKYIIFQHAITDITVYSSSRLQIILESNLPDEVIVSRERVQEFKKWLEEM